jgi:hypothetical protein
MTIKYTSIFQRPPKFNQIGIFGMKIYHLAATVRRSRNRFKARSYFPNPAIFIILFFGQNWRRNIFAGLLISRLVSARQIQFRNAGLSSKQKVVRDVVCNKRVILQ